MSKVLLIAFFFVKWEIFNAKPQSCKGAKFLKVICKIISAFAFSTILPIFIFAALALNCI